MWTDGPIMPTVARGISEVATRREALSNVSHVEANPAGQREGHEDSGGRAVTPSPKRKSCDGASVDGGDSREGKDMGRLRKSMYGRRLELDKDVDEKKNSVPASEYEKMEEDVTESSEDSNDGICVGGGDSRPRKDVGRLRQSKFGRCVELDEDVDEKKKCVAAPEAEKMEDDVTESSKKEENNVVESKKKEEDDAFSDGLIKEALELLLDDEPDFQCPACGLTIRQVKGVGEGDDDVKKEMTFETHFSAVDKHAYFAPLVEVDRDGKLVREEYNAAAKWEELDRHLTMFIDTLEGISNGNTCGLDMSSLTGWKNYAKWHVCKGNMSPKVAACDFLVNLRLMVNKYENALAGSLMCWTCKVGLNKLRLQMCSFEMFVIESGLYEINDSVAWMDKELIGGAGTDGTPGHVFYEEEEKKVAAVSFDDDDEAEVAMRGRRFTPPSVEHDILITAGKKDVEVVDAVSDDEDAVAEKLQLLDKHLEKYELLRKLLPGKMESEFKRKIRNERHNIRVKGWTADKAIQNLEKNVGKPRTNFEMCNLVSKAIIESQAVC